MSLAEQMCRYRRLTRLPSLNAAFGHAGYNFSMADEVEQNLKRANRTEDRYRNKFKEPRNLKTTVDEYIELNGNSPESACKLIKSGPLWVFMSSAERFEINKEVFKTYVKAKAIHTGRLPTRLEKKYLRRGKNFQLDQSMGHKAEEYMIGKLGGLDRDMCDMLVEYSQENILEDYLFDCADKKIKLEEQILSLDAFKAIASSLHQVILQRVDASAVLEILYEPLDAKGLHLLFEWLDW